MDGMPKSDKKLSEQRVNDAKAAFNLFDKKGKGCVSSNELDKVFKSLGLAVNDEKLKSWADEADEEATGHIKFEHFLPLFVRKVNEDEDEREMKQAFRVLDKHHTGCIDVEDLKWILRSLGDDLSDDEIEQMIAETDTDGSGTVDYDEFKNLMTSE